MSVSLVQDCALVLNTKSATELWCVYEHLVSFSADQPPQVIYVNACRLQDVWKMTEARSNSEWQAIFAQGGHTLVRVVAIADNRDDATKHARAHIATFDPMPRCNLRGFNNKGAARRVVCSNGTTYPTQSAAAAALGVTQSAISQALRGDLKQVGGWSFEYAPHGSRP